MATIYDVAKAAGVSSKTVSRVINNEPHVSEELQERVRAAIEELDYRPKFSARQMRTQKSDAIALITDEIAITPYAVDVIRGAFKEAWKHHKLLLIVNTEFDSQIEQNFMQMMLERQIDGIIYATIAHLPASLPTDVRKIPTVLLNCFVEDHSLPSVVPDEIKGGYTATKKLLSKGHQRIGFINNVDKYPAAAGRYQGYKQALQEFNIALDPELVVTSPVIDDEFGYEGARQLMSKPNPPTALFCFNDRMAAGAYRALNELNLSIPNDVAVVGFDNQEAISTLLTPPLTTVQLPHYEMGQWAVQKLLQLIDKSDNSSESKPIQHKLECPLIERSSV